MYRKLFLLLTVAALKAGAQTPVVTTQPQPGLKKAIPVLIQGNNNNNNNNQPPAPPVRNSPYVSSFKDVKEGVVYRITNNFTGKQVEVEDAVFSKGKKVQQWEFSEADAFKDIHNQRWILLVSGYDVSRGLHFRIINYGFLNALMHNPNNDVFAGTVQEYGINGYNYEWYLRSLPTMKDYVEIRSLANNKRLRLGAISRDNGIGFALEESETPDINAAFRFTYNGVAVPDPKFVNASLKIRNEEQSDLFISVYQGKPAVARGGNITGNDQHMRFRFEAIPGTTQYTIKSEFNNQYLRYDEKTGQFSFVAQTAGTPGTYFTIIPLERNKGKYFIKPEGNSGYLRPGFQYIPGGGLDIMNLGFALMENDSPVRWTFEF